MPIDNNSLTVEFAALDFSAPDRNRYEYRLEAFDKGWIASPASRRLAAYTNLPPGGYTLHVRGSNREGAWSEAVLDIPIRVLPAWFQAAWFRLVVASAVFAFVLILVQGRTVLLRRRKRELELLVAERTGELEESKRQIELFAYHDALTGLPNRRLFTEELRVLIAASARHGSAFALLMIDLDHFKQSTIRWGTMRAMRCCWKRRGGCERRYAFPIAWCAWAATSSPSSSPICLVPRPRGRVLTFCAGVSWRVLPVRLSFRVWG